MIPCVEYSGKTMRSMPWLESGLGLGSGSASRSGVGLGRGRGRGYRQALLGTLDEIADARDVVHDLGVGMQPRHLVLEDAHACVITSGPLHCGLHASHTAQGNDDGQKGDKRRRGARDCRTHGRLVRKMPQRHLVRPGTRRCKLAKRDCVCSRGATQRAPTVPEHRRVSLRLARQVRARRPCTLGHRAP